MLLPRVAVLSAAVALFGAMAQASPIHMTLSGTIDTEILETGLYLPVGTVVTGEIDFDVGPGLPGSAALTDASGAFTWNNSGARQAVVDGITLVGRDAAGRVTLGFHVTEPSYPNLQRFLVGLDIGVNPFTTSEQFYDVLLGAQVLSFGIAIVTTDGGGVSTSDLTGPVEGTLVPEPAGLALLAIGLVTLTGIRRRRRA